MTATLKQLALALFASLAVALNVGAETCPPQSDAIEFDLSAPRSASMAIAIPPTIFGFNIPWFHFQDGYVDSTGGIRREVIDLLSPFRGAILRYPGGTESNWFEWRKSIGPLAGRKPIQWIRGKDVLATFGVDEFLQLVEQINAVPLFVVNLSGRINDLWSDEQLDREARDFAAYLRDKLPPEKKVTCRDDVRSCTSAVIELGNEMDWPPFKWPADQYIHRAKIVARAFHDVLPSAIVTAHLTSSPWGATGQAQAALRSDYSNAIPRELGSLSDAYSFHPYYDGVIIPAMLRHLDDLAVAFHRSHPAKPFHLYISEYGRWPNEVPGRNWREQWHLTEDMSGALSTGDFLLSLMPRSEVRGAALHALGIYGPWQIIRKVRNSDLLYPTAVYWGMRGIREATFDKLLAHGTIASPQPAYAKSYDARFAITESTDKRTIGIAIVNRSSAPLRLVLNDKASLFTDATLTVRVVAGRDTEHEHNDDSDPKAVTMSRLDMTKPEGSTKAATRSLCVAGRSISTFVLAQPPQ